MLGQATAFGYPCRKPRLAHALSLGQILMFRPLGFQSNSDPLDVPVWVFTSRAIGLCAWGLATVSYRTDVDLKFGLVDLGPFSLRGPSHYARSCVSAVCVCDVLVWRRPPRTQERRVHHRPSWRGSEEAPAHLGFSLGPPVAE